MRQALIYGLRDPETLKIRYIGQTRCGLARPLSHWENSRLLTRQDKCHCWIRSLVARNLLPEIVELERPEISLLPEREKHFISALKPDMNMTPGGEGWEPSAEIRQKIRLSLLGNTRRRGKTFSSKSRELLSRAAKGKPKSLEHKAKLAENLRKARAARKCSKNGS